MFSNAPFDPSKLRKSMQRTAIGAEVFMFTTNEVIVGKIFRIIHLEHCLTFSSINLSIPRQLNLCWNKEYSLILGHHGVFWVYQEGLLVRLVEGFHYYSMNIDGRRHCECRVSILITLECMDEVRLAKGLVSLGDI
jgi:hypothetical protein